MDIKLKRSLKSFLNNNSRARVENDGVAVWNEILTDLPYFDGKQPRVSIAFSRYQGHHVDKTVLSDILKNGKSQVIGLIVAVPSFWLNVDTYLAECYVEYWVDEFINEYFCKKPDKPACPQPQAPCPVRPAPQPHPVMPPREPLPPGFSPAGTPTPPPMFFPEPQPNPGTPPMSPPRPGGIPQDFNRM